MNIDMVKVAYDALDEKKGEAINIIDISNISVMADFFLIATAGSTLQLKALIDNVCEKLTRAGFKIKSMEGGKDSSWVLIDCGDMIVHIFDREARDFYDLERIWNDGTVVDRESLDK